MSQKAIRRSISIVIYVLPILLVGLLIKNINYITITVSIMTILVGFSIRFIPNIIGLNKLENKFSYIFVIILGILSLLIIWL